MKNHKISWSILTGVLWLMFQSVGSRVISFVGQITLAWILIPDDFGKISIVYAITNICFLTQQLGLTDVLIKRRKINLWINHAVSISLIVAIISLLLSNAFGLLAGYLYKDPQISWLISIYSLVLPFYALTTVADAKLRIDVNFKILSITKTLENLFIVGVTVLLAYLGLRAFSFVIPIVLAAFLRYIVLNHYASLSLKIKFVFRRLKYLLVDSTWGLFHMLFQRIINQMDYLIIGYLYEQVILGIYYMAFSLSVQAISLIALNIPPVLYPSLNLIRNDSNSQKEYIIKTSSVIAFFAVPFASWQFAISEPLVKLLLSDKWLPTIPLIEILSIGMAFRSGTWLWSVPYKLVGKFSLLSKISFLSLLFLICLLLPLTYSFGAVGTAIGVSIFYAILSPIWLGIGIKLLNGNWFDVVKIIGYPLLFSFMSFGLCKFVVTEFMKNMDSIVVIMTVTGLGFGLYILLFLIFQRVKISIYRAEFRAILASR